MEMMGPKKTGRGESLKTGSAAVTPFSMIPVLLKEESDRAVDPVLCAHKQNACSGPRGTLRLDPCGVRTCAHVGRRVFTGSSQGASSVPCQHTPPSAHAACTSASALAASPALHCLESGPRPA